MFQRSLTGLLLIGLLIAGGTVFAILTQGAINAFAATMHPEKTYQTAWCDEHKGEMEYVVSGGSRVDCLTEKYAVEVDFAHKWQEAIGQALYYARKTDRAPGIVLIMEKSGDHKYLGRLFYTIKERDEFIKVWTIGPGDL